VTAEHDRLADLAWKRWGPYLSERAWGTVREDYSADGDAWSYLPHDHARSRAYRWGEDGLGGICDIHQHVCLAFAFWNGRDPILKERIFGLTGEEGNHGEDAKEYWWYLDSTPTHSFMRWRYAYPQGAFPYDRLVTESRRRTRRDPELELLDTGAFDDDRYWELTAEYAKASPDDVAIRLLVRNQGPAEELLHVLPTLWFRNTWSWDGSPRPGEIRTAAAGLEAEHEALGRLTLTASGEPEALFCENESNTGRLFGAPGPRYPKDGIGDHVVAGAASVDPGGRGTKAALRYRLRVAPGQQVELRLRLAPAPADVGPAFDALFELRRREADEFYDALVPRFVGDEERLVLRQAFAGLLWSKQFYRYDVERWLAGDPAEPAPPAARRRGRNAGWQHLDAADVLSMPDVWEYPWFAAWDLAFHCVTLAHVDPELAKHQLRLLCREWYMHPNGQLPAYEWSFGDVNPPVHAWAALRVFEIDGSRDYLFLERLAHKLLLNFNWWVNRKDSEGDNVFEGGFLGLDNIGPFDRSAVPAGETLEQSDATAWMAAFCLSMLEISLVLAEHNPSYEDLATKFAEHFAAIATAINRQGLWDDEDGFYYDALRAGGQQLRVRVRSAVGLIPLLAVTTIEEEALARLPDFAKRMRWFLAHKRGSAAGAAVTTREPGATGSAGSAAGAAGPAWLLAIVDPIRLPRVLSRLLDETEFLSPHGIRSLSRYHAEHPYSIDVAGVSGSVDYEPAESTTGLFGGNSNWRGPVWFPLNYLLIEALLRFHRFLGDSFTVEHPTGSGRAATLAEIAGDLAGRLVSLFVDDASGRRPCFGGVEGFQSDPRWHDQLLFHEYFNGDDGAGLGASHQTGWTALVADLILRRAAGGEAAGTGRFAAGMAGRR